MERRWRAVQGILSTVAGGRRCFIVDGVEIGCTSKPEQLGEQGSTATYATFTPPTQTGLEGLIGSCGSVWQHIGLKRHRKMVPDRRPCRDLAPHEPDHEGMSFLEEVGYVHVELFLCTHSVSVLVRQGPVWPGATRPAAGRNSVIMSSMRFPRSGLPSCRRRSASVPAYPRPHFPLHVLGAPRHMAGAVSRRAPSAVTLPAPRAVCLAVPLAPSWSTELQCPSTSPEPGPANPTKVHRIEDPLKTPAWLKRRSGQFGRSAMAHPVRCGDWHGGAAAASRTDHPGDGQDDLCLASWFSEPAHCGVGCTGRC